MTDQAERERPPLTKKTTTAKKTKKRAAESPPSPSRKPARAAAKASQAPQTPARMISILTRGWYAFSVLSGLVFALVANLTNGPQLAASVGWSTGFLFIVMWLGGAAAGACLAFCLQECLGTSRWTRPFILVASAIVGILDLASVGQVGSKLAQGVEASGVLLFANELVLFGMLLYSARTLTNDDVKAYCDSEPAKVETWREKFTNTYLSIDKRTLGLTRVCLGWFLIGDLFRRTPDWIHLFGNTGVLPTELILTRPQANGFSLLHGFAANWELWSLWGVIFVTYVCLLIGYKTKVAQILSLLFVTSMNGRVLLIENGGYVVHNLLLLWTCFMPLGDRFSLDAMLTSMKRKREHTAADLNDRTDMLEPFRKLKFVSFVCLVLLLQLSAVYYFNKIHKTGPAWQFTENPWNRDQGPRAVHYVMYVDRMVNPLIADVRTHIPFWMYEIMTRSVLASEMLLAYLFLTPVPKVWARRIAIVVVNFLHVGFGSTFVLGPFAWALCVFSTLLFQTEDWDAVNKVIRREHRARTVLFDPTSGAALWFCRVIKRLDRYDLLGFDELGEGQRKEALVVERLDGTQVTGRLAFAEILAALPTGAFFAPLIAWSSPKRFAVGFGLAALLAVGIILPHASVQVWHSPWGRIDSWQYTTGIIVGLVFGMPVAFAGTFVEWAMVRGRWSKFFKLKTDDQTPEVDPGAAPLRQRFRWFGGLTRELLIAALFIGAVNQALTELWVTKGPWGEAVAALNKTDFVKQHFDTPLTIQSEYTQPLAHKLRFLQGWFMFSPNPVMDDGTIVVDAVTADGRHVDPFWGIAPDFDLINAKSYGYSQIWSDYFNRIHGNRTYWDAMVDYMRLLPDRTHNPNDKIVSGEVYWTHDMNPRWGTTESWGYGKDLMFTFGENGGAQTPPPPPQPIQTLRPPGT